MKADRPLWADLKGRLCDAPPSTGFQLAAFAGQEIHVRLVQRYGLQEIDGKVVQPGQEIQHPVSTPPPMVADRELFATPDLQLHDSEVAGSIKLCDAGAEIPQEYIDRYGLREKEGKIVATKAVKQPENKMVAQPENKRGGLKIRTKGK